MTNNKSLTLWAHDFIYFTILVEVHYVYKISKTWAFCFQTRFLKFFPYVGLYKTSDPQSRAIFDTRAIIWTTLVEVH